MEEKLVSEEEKSGALTPALSPREREESMARFMPGAAKEVLASPTDFGYTPSILIQKGTTGISDSKRLPPKEIVYIPVERSPEDWTKKDKRNFTNAVCMGVTAGILLGGLVLFFGFTCLSGVFLGM